MNLSTIITPIVQIAADQRDALFNSAMIGFVGVIVFFFISFIPRSYPDDNLKIPLWHKILLAAWLIFWIGPGILAIWFKAVLG